MQLNKLAKEVPEVFGHDEVIEIPSRPDFLDFMELPPGEKVTNQTCASQKI